MSVYIQLCYQLSVDIENVTMQQAYVRNLDGVNNNILYLFMSQQVS